MGDGWSGEQFECLVAGEKFECLGGEGVENFLSKKIVVFMFMLHVILIWCYVTHIIPVKYVLSAQIVTLFTRTAYE